MPNRVATPEGAQLKDFQTRRPFSTTAGYSRLELLLLAVLVLALLCRFIARPYAPFWIDEAATGSILAEDTYADFIRDVRWHVSSPLYFVFLREWSHIFGLSNFALRFPSALFSIAAPLVILLYPVNGMGRLERLNWAALVALWIPGVGFGQAARPYALEMLFATAQTVAFARLLSNASLRSTSIWVGLSALTISTHYLAAPLALVQGLIFLTLHRWEAVKQWPALLLLLPAIVLVAWQAPEMFRFMQPGTTWYRVYGLRQVNASLDYLIGSHIAEAGLGILLAVAGWTRLKRKGADDFRPGLLLWVGGASAIGAAILIAAATQRPMMTDRYLVPFAPGFLLLIPMLLRKLAKSSAAWAATATIVPFALGLLLWLALGARHPDSVVEELNYEHASHDIMRSGVKSVVFLWDNPNSQAMHLEQIKEYGRFFFKRARYDIEVIPARPNPQGDSNPLLLNAAQPKRSAILWVYDNWVLQTTTRLHPPRIDKIDQSWACSTRRKKKIGIVTCLPR